MPCAPLQTPTHMPPPHSHTHAPSHVHTFSAGGGGGPPVTRLVTGGKEQVAAVGWSYDCGTLVTTDKAGAVAFWQCNNA